MEKPTKSILHTFYYMGKVTKVVISGEDEEHVNIFDKKLLDSMGRYCISIDAAKDINEKQTIFTKIAKKWKNLLKSKS